MRQSLCPGTKGDKPNYVWSGLKHLRTDEHGKHSDPWSELRFETARGNVACLSSCVARAPLLLVLSVRTS